MGFVLNEALRDLPRQILIEFGPFFERLQELGVVPEGFAAVGHQLQLVIK